MTSYHADKPNFLEFWVKMAKMTLKVKANDPYFQYQPRVSHDACLVQIWWFHLKSVTSYRADKVNFMDGRMDRRRQRQYPFSLKGQGVKKDPVITITRFNSIVFVIENVKYVRESVPSWPHIVKTWLMSVREWHTGTKAWRKWPSLIHVYCHVMSHLISQVV